MDDTGLDVDTSVEEAPKLTEAQVKHLRSFRPGEFLPWKKAWYRVIAVLPRGLILELIEK